MAREEWACVNRGWLIAIGALFIILRIMAIVEPFLAGVAIAFLQADCPRMSPSSTPPLSPLFFGSRNTEARMCDPAGRNTSSIRTGAHDTNAQTILCGTCPSKKSGEMLRSSHYIYAATLMVMTRDGGKKVNEVLANYGVFRITYVGQSRLLERPFVVIFQPWNELL